MKRTLQGRYLEVAVASETVRAFGPAPLSPEPPVFWWSALRRRFDAALVALGRLDAITALLPNASLLLYSFVRREAVLSSQIEGTQSSLADLLLYEIDEQPGVPVEDPREVSRCVAALAYVQFETIHPFLDGNGRLGRLLIVLQLVADGVLREPMLYPSLFFKTHRALYYELLNEVRLRGDWERWLDFFAEGIEASATQAVATANALLSLVNSDRDRIAGLGRAAASALTVHQALQRQPIATSAALVKATGLTAATVNKSLAHLEGIGIVGEVTNRQRGRVFSYRRYVEQLSAELEAGA
jgi:Fic family protein